MARRVRVVAVVAVVACWACGGTTHDPDPIPHGPPPPPAPTTCADLGVILRGPIDSDGSGGSAREAAIANACRTDKWSAKVISCVGSSRHPATCLDKLLPEQRQSYQAALDKWSQQFGGDSYGGDDYGGVVGGVVGGMRFVDCADITQDPSKFPPAIGQTAPEREWDVHARSNAISKSCEFGVWDELTKECLETAVDTTAVEACMRTEPLGDELRAELTEIDELARKIDAAKHKPKTIDCAHVVAAYYADAKWKGKLADAKPAARTRMIAGSRTAMQKACVAEGWNDTQRACIVIEGGDRCWAQNNGTAVWSFPAVSVLEAPAGVPAECAAYQKAIERLMTCSKMPDAARASMKRAFQQSVAAWTSMPADQRSTLASSCKSAADATQQVISSAGC